MRGPPRSIAALPVREGCLLLLTDRFEAPGLRRGSWLRYFDQRHKEHTEREPKEEADSARDENITHGRFLPVSAPEPARIVIKK
jgi:hypothetical protein